MNKEFIPYKQALELKELGFDEECLASWNFYTKQLNFNGQPSNFRSEDIIQIATFSQAFRWFREKHNLPSNLELFHVGWDYVIIPSVFEDLTDFGDGPYKTYEEAELACLRKLIEIVKNK